MAEWGEGGREGKLRGQRGVRSEGQRDRGRTMKKHAVSTKTHTHTHTHTQKLSPARARSLSRTRAFSLTRARTHKHTDDIASHLGRRGVELEEGAVVSVHRAPGQHHRHASPHTKKHRHRHAGMQALRHTDTSTHRHTCSSRGYIHRWRRLYLILSPSLLPSSLPLSLLSFCTATPAHQDSTYAGGEGYIRVTAFLGRQARQQT